MVDPSDGQKTLFAGLDFDNDDAITVADLRKGAERAHYCIPDTDIEKWITAFDVPASTGVKFANFKGADTKRLQGLALFLRMDQDHDGTVSKQDFANALQELLGSSKDCELLFSQVDLDHDGFISCADIIQLYVRSFPSANQ